MTPTDDGAMQDAPTISQRGGVVLRYLVLGGADVAAKALRFAVAMVVVRHFGAAGLGEVSFALSVVTFAVLMGTCGTDLYAVRTVARVPKSLRAMSRTIVALRFSLGLGVYVLLLGVALLLPSLQEIFWLIAILGLTVLTSAVSLLWVPQALQRTSALALALLGTQVLYLLLIAVGLRVHDRLWTIPAAQVIAEGMVAVGLFVWTTRIVNRMAHPVPAEPCKQILRESAPIGGALLLRGVALGSDLVLLGFLLTNQELGWYVGANRLFMLGVSLGGTYFVILFPRLSQRASVRAEIRREVTGSLRRMIPILVPVAAIAAFFSKPLLQTLFDPTFEAASVSLQILLVAWGVTFVAGHYRFTLLARGRQRQDFVLVGIAATVHVALKLLLIPAWGIEGAAFGTLLGELTLAVLVWERSRSDLRITSSARPAVAPAPFTPVS